MRILLYLLFSIVMFSSCEDFFDPTQDILIEDESIFKDWYEYRAAAMGMYGIQQQLAEQLFVLGELRSDLVAITENADADLVEIYNFNPKPSPNNKYASPVNFFKLIATCNNLIAKLQTFHPEVLETDVPVTNYDRLYGEVICMRAWAYFNAVRIYGKVPFIHESLTTIEETQAYINSPGIYTDSVHIIFGIDGYANDTILNNNIELEKKYYDQKLVIDHFTNELLTKVKAVGVDYSLINEDDTWEVTVWNQHAMNALLGIMFLTEGDLAGAARYFEKIVYLQSANQRYQLDNTFSYGNWQTMFTSLDNREHILTLWFNKSNQQQNDFSEILQPFAPHKYMLKPTKQAVDFWETIWDDFAVEGNNENPQKAKLITKGRPGDFYRGYGSSFAYAQNNSIISSASIQEMLILKSEGDYRSANSIIAGADTVIWKYALGQGLYSEDPYFIIYRAAGIHLWLAEVYTFWEFFRDGGVKPFYSNAVNIISDGSNYETSSSRSQLGIRGRFGYSDVKYVSNHLVIDDRIKIGNIIYERDPVTNEVIGYKDFRGNVFGLQLYLEEQVLNERARELAFEGERFYDLMRVAKRRNDPSFLAGKVSAKFPAGERERIYSLLLDENNWYINYFDE